MSKHFKKGGRQDIVECGVIKLIVTFGAEKVSYDQSPQSMGKNTKGVGLCGAF